MYHQDREACESMLTALSEALMPEGFMFLVGPRQLQGLFDHYKLDALYNDPIYNMPFFRQHLKMCPENQVNPDLVVFLAQKKGEEKKFSCLFTLAMYSSRYSAKEAIFVTHWLNTSTVGAANAAEPLPL